MSQIPQSARLKFSPSLPGLLLGLFIILYIVVISLLHALRLAHFMDGFDLAFYQQAIWNTSQGRFLQVSATDFSNSLLGTDVILIYALMAPFYLVVPSPMTLLVVETVVVGLGAIPVYLLARERIGNAWAGLSLGLVYLLLPVVENGNLYELRERPMAGSFLLWAFWFWYRRKLGWFILFAALALCCRPENGFVLVMLGVYGWLSDRLARRSGKPQDRVMEQRFIWTPIILGIAWFGAALLVIRAATTGGSFALGSTFAGGSPVSALFTPFVDPVKGFQQLFPTGDILLGKLLYIPLLLLPLAFLPLWRPLPLLMALPPVGLNLLAAQNRSIQWDAFDYHYQASIVPWLLVAAIFALAAIKERPAAFVKNLNSKIVPAMCAGLVGLVIIINLWVNIAPPDATFWPRVANGWGRILRSKEDGRWASGKALLSQVPDDAPLAISNTWAPYVKTRQGLWLWLRRPLYSLHPEQDARYIFADARDPKSEEALMVNDALATGKWRKQDEAAGYVLLVRTSGG